MPENLNTKLVLFDLDGTLIDTAPDFLSSLNTVLTRYKKKNVSASEIRTYISEGSSKLIKYAFNIDETDKDFKRYKNEFLLEYKSNLTAQSDLFDGIERLISYLSQNEIMYGIVTNKFFEYADPIVRSFPQLNDLKILICPDHVAISKPDPEGILLACNKLNVRTDETVYLGDHENDLRAGISAGAKVIGCLYGYSLSKGSIDKYDCVYVNNANEIMPLIK